MGKSEITKEQLSELGFDDKGYKDTGERWVYFSGNTVYLGGDSACTLGHCYDIKNVTTMERLKAILKCVEP